MIVDDDNGDDSHEGEDDQSVDDDQDEQHEEYAEDHQCQAHQKDDAPRPQPYDSYNDWSSDDDRDTVFGYGPGQRRPYEPTVGDVFLVKRRIQRIGKLPTEIVDIIIDHAEYWPHTHADAQFESQNILSVYTSRNNASSENRFLCRTVPLGFTNAYPGNPDATYRYTTAPTEPRPLPNQDEAHPGFDTTCLPETIRTWLPGVNAHLTEHPCRKIVFTIVSRDQGWASNRSNYGTYTGSYTWFDVGLERYGREAVGRVPVRQGSMPADAQLYTILPVLDRSNTAYYFAMLPDEECLMRNKVASNTWTTQTVEWSWTDSTPGEAPGQTEGQTEGQTPGEAAEQWIHPLHGTGRGLATGDGNFVRNLRIGDVVTVWAKARFPGWTNHVHSVHVKVYWAV